MLLELDTTEWFRFLASPQLLSRRINEAIEGIILQQPPSSFLEGKWEDQWYPVELQINPDGSMKATSSVFGCIPDFKSALRIVSQNSTYAQTGLKTCPCANARPLTIHTKYFTCDVCDKKNIPTGTLMLGCRECNWDMCLGCVERRGYKVVSGSPATQSRRPRSPTSRSPPTRSPSRRGSSDTQQRECKTQPPARAPLYMSGNGYMRRKGYCFKFNEREECNRPNCPYKHKCMACEGDHPEADCENAHGARPVMHDPVNSVGRSPSPPHREQKEIERTSTVFDKMQKGYSDDAAMAEALKRSQKSSPPVKKEPTRLCDACGKMRTKPQFDADQWSRRVSRAHSRCKSCVQKAVRKMNAEQRTYGNDNSVMAEAMRRSREAQDIQMKNSRGTNQAKEPDSPEDDICSICLGDGCQESTTWWKCGKCLNRDCGNPKRISRSKCRCGGEWASQAHRICQSCANRTLKMKVVCEHRSRHQARNCKLCNGTWEKPHPNCPFCRAHPITCKCLECIASLSQNGLNPLAKAFSMGG